MQPNEIVSFDNPEFGQVRAVEVDGKPIFCAKDIAKALNYSDTKNAIKLHCKGVAFYHPLETAGGTQKMRFITEPDVYRLITHSKLPNAQRFESWVFEEVLPRVDAPARLPDEGQRKLAQHADAAQHGTRLVRDKGNVHHPQRRPHNRAEDPEGDGQGPAVLHQPLSERSSVMSKQINNQAMDNLVTAELKLKGLQEVMLALTESPVSLEHAPHLVYYAVSDIAEDLGEALDSMLDRK